MEEKTEYWNPEKGEMIEGVLVDKLSDVGKYNTRLYKIQDGDVTYCVWGKVQLDSIMEATNIGDLISLKYVGVEKTKEYSMKRYELEILNEQGQ